MLEYEMETRKRSIGKYIKRPDIGEITDGEMIIGSIEPTNGYLEWLKNR